MEGNMRKRQVSLPALFFIAFCLALLPYVCEGGAKSKPMGQPTKKTVESKPRLIVLPLQPKEGQTYDGIGLGVHFLLGNVVAPHTGLKEFWFGWRVKNIFPQKENLIAYCHGEGPRLNLGKLGKEQDIRYWLWGNVQKQENKLQIALVLVDTKGERDEWITELILDPSDQLIEFRKRFLAWLDDCGLPFPDAQVAKALWPEKTTLRSLDLLGRDLKTYYLHASWGDKGAFDPGLFDPAVSAAPSSYLAHDLKGWVMYRNKDYKSAEKSFRSAIKINPDGLGAISGLMWCAVYTNDIEKAYKWATAKADIRGESREAARARVDRRIKKAFQ
jgi:tetratricopeptide (TPR) repeat protein